MYYLGKGGILGQNELCRPTKFMDLVFIILISKVTLHLIQSIWIYTDFNFDAFFIYGVGDWHLDI